MTEGELGRHALGRGLIMKHTNKIVLIRHARKCVLCSPGRVWDLVKSGSMLKNQVFPAAEIPRVAVAQDPSPMMMRMPRIFSLISFLYLLSHHATRKRREMFCSYRRRLLRETLPPCKFFLLRSRPPAALAHTAPLGSLAQGFRAFRAQVILLCWREISQNWQRFVLAGFLLQCSSPLVSSLKLLR